MNTVTVTLTAKFEAFPNIPLILKRRKMMKKTLKAIRKCNETKDHHFVFNHADSNVQIYVNFCGICGNYIRKGSGKFELHPKLACCDLNHHKIENAKIYHEEMKRCFKKIKLSHEFFHEEKICEELQKISYLTKDWLTCI